MSEVGKYCKSLGLVLAKQTTGKTQANLNGNWLCDSVDEMYIALQKKQVAKHEVINVMSMDQ